MKAALLVSVVFGACGGGDDHAPDASGAGASGAEASSDAGPMQFTLREVGRATVFYPMFPTRLIQGRWHRSRRPERRAPTQVLRSWATAYISRTRATG
jgi:hypothetical protein